VKGFTQVVTGAGHWVRICGQVVTTALVAQTVGCAGTGQTVATLIGQIEGSAGHFVMFLGQVVGATGQLVTATPGKQAVASLGQVVGAKSEHIVGSFGQLVARIGQAVAAAGHWVLVAPVQAVNTFGQVVATRPPSGQMVGCPCRHAVGALPGQVV
jgi:hypothetical protein